MERAQEGVVELSRRIDELPDGPLRDRAWWDRALIQAAIAAHLEGPAREIAKHEIGRAPGQVH